MEILAPIIAVFTLSLLNRAFAVAVDDPRDAVGVTAWALVMRSRRLGGPPQRISVRPA